MPHDVRVLDQFSPEDVASIRALADEIEATSGTNPFGEVTWTGLDGRGTLGDRGILLPAPVDGEVAAYVHLAHHQPDEWSAEFAVRAGADDVLGGLLAEAIEVIAREGGGHLTLWLHGEQAAEAPSAAGFVPERELLEMRVPLPLAAGPRWPDGITVRPFVVGQDEDEWLAVNNRAFAGHPEQGGWALETLLQREQAAWFTPEGFLLAFASDDDGDGMAGFCWTKIHPAEPPKEPVALGEIYVIGADPLRQGIGLGRALTVGGLASLAERGITLGMLFVDGANEAAVGLYRSLGFVTHRLDRAYGMDVAPSGTTRA